MKKKILFALVLLTAAAAVLLAACGSDKTGGRNTEATTAKSSAYTAQSKTTEAPETKKGREAHEEYVETYYIYAETGAVVTWYDSQTGEYKYKCKCEECGHISSSEHTNHRLTVQGASYNSSYVCENSDCIMWGKSQPVKISCNVSGEWVDVYD